MGIAIAHMFSFVSRYGLRKSCSVDRLEPSLVQVRPDATQDRQPHRHGTTILLGIHTDWYRHASDWERFAWTQTNANPVELLDPA